MAINDKTKWKNPSKTCDQLWEEYSYRHSHIWRVVFQTTAAIVALSIVPYLSSAMNAGFLRFVPLIIAVGLAFFSLSRMNREFLALKPVKDAYLSRTREPIPDADASSFQDHTLWYLRLLALGAAGHAIIVVIALLISDEWQSILSINLLPYEDSTNPQATP